MSTSLAGKNLGVLGFGKLGEAITLGLIERGLFDKERVRATVRREGSAASARERTQLAVGTDSPEVAAWADVLLIAVKPQAVAGLLAPLAERVRPGTLVISVAASVRTAAIEAQLPEGIAVIRAMPNTPCVLGAGMTVLARGAHVTDAHLECAREMFDAVGRTTELDERHLDSVTGLSGSGPAYIYVVIESLAEAGVKLGIPRETATLLSAQTVLAPRPCWARRAWCSSAVSTRLFSKTR
ncbi:MAG: pyrroline-5-carboxylate reductase family protein [Planctomycetota bacterium]|jgi:pyrroline-5-carboxylate reductase